MKLSFPAISIVLLTALLMAGGCSSRAAYPVVSENSKVSRDKALIVMGVSFWEVYKDAEDDTTKKIFSADLLKDEKRVSSLLAEKKGTLLDRPLHYLSRFRFQFTGRGQTEHEFVRFDLDTREYEPIAIHEFTTGPVSLTNIATVQYYHEEKRHRRDDENEWVKHWTDYKEAYGSWELTQGKVTYLGHLTLYFKTEQFIMGLITPRTLIERPQLVAIVIEDRFEEVKQQLQTEKPWFPVVEMENQSRPGKWVYLEDEFETFTEAPQTDVTDKNRKPKRDVKKYFF